MLTRHNLVVARNTTLEEVSCKVNEYSVSDNTLYRCVDVFNLNRKNCVEGIKVLDDNSCRTVYKTRSYPDYLRRDKVFELPLTIY